MLFFRRLLSFQPGSKLLEKRGARRHATGPGFPLKGVVCLLGRDTMGQVSRGGPAASCEWSGRVVNLSDTGLSLSLPPAALTGRGEQTNVGLKLDAHRLVIPGVVAHYRTYPSHALCGLSLTFPDPSVRTAYLQLLETVGIGASFEPVKPAGAARDPAGLVREQYRARNRFLLTAWRGAGSRELAGFELLMENFCAKGEARARELEIYSRPPPGPAAKTALSAPALSLSAGVHGEVRQLYRWIVLNLPRAVPADLRALLERFVRQADIGTLPKPG